MVWVLLNQTFDILKMCANLKSLRVRKLIGKPRVPYNRGLGVRGSSHPFLCCRLFHASRREQRLPYPCGLSLFGLADYIKQLPCFAWRKPGCNDDSLGMFRANPWPSDAFFHNKCLQIS
jgi:hypothetical protein